jgi:PadR family transcriptional regulator, regulatory protein PadR
MRLTYALVRVAGSFAAGNPDKQWAYSICKATGLKTGVVCPLLARMVAEGWLSVKVESKAAYKARGAVHGRRRYYATTKKGRSAMADILERAAADTRFRRDLESVG